MRLSAAEREWFLRAVCGAALPVAGLWADAVFDDSAAAGYAYGAAELYFWLLFPFALFWRAPAENGGRIGGGAAGERIAGYIFLFFILSLLGFWFFYEGGYDAEKLTHGETAYWMLCWVFPQSLVVGFISQALWNFPPYATGASFFQWLKTAFVFAAVWLSLALAWSPERGADNVLTAAATVLLYGGAFFAGLGARKYFRIHRTAPRGVLRFEFKGEGVEYFKICAANFFLSVITLGGYSPWAKIRAKNYLYGNTFLEGANFEYRPNPWAIFCARLIIIPALVFWEDIYGFIIGQLARIREYLSGLGVFAESSAPDELYYAAQIITVALFLFAYFALFLRGMSFNARVSRHRNIAFQFRRNRQFLFFLALLLGVIIAGSWINTAIHLVIAGLEAKVGGYSGCGQLNHNFCMRLHLAEMTSEYFRAAYYAPFIFIAGGVLAFSVFLLWMFHLWFGMRAGNFSWGGMRFRFAAPFRKTALILSPAFLVIWAAYGALLAAVLMMSFERGAEADWLMSQWRKIGVAEETAGGVLLLLFLYLYLSSAGFKYFWNHASFDGGRVRCGFSAADYMRRIVVVNLTAIIFSLGILAPWARIRRSRYLAQHMWLEADAEVLQRQKPKEGEKTGAFGGEATDAAGFDIALV